MVVLAPRADLQPEASHADVVAPQAIGQRREVELHGFGHTRARDLKVEVDLRGRTELALEEPLEAQQLLVSRSALELRFEQREVAGLAIHGDARCSAGEGQTDEQQQRSHV